MTIDNTTIGKLPERFIVKLNGKDFVQYEGLLELAHQKGIKSLKTDLVQIPTQDNDYVCIMKADLVGKDDSEFSDFGDASPESLNGKLVPHMIRMASTRAKARTLRDFTNVGMCCVEELDGGDILKKQDKNSEPITDKQKKILKDNFDKIKNIFGSIEDINGLSKANASEIIGKYILKDKDSKAKSKKPQDKVINNASDGEKASSGQISYIGVLTKQIALKQGKEQKDIEKAICEQYKISSLNDLSKYTAIKLVDSLKKKLTVA